MVITLVYETMSGPLKTEMMHSSKTMLSYQERKPP